MKKIKKENNNIASPFGLTQILFADSLIRQLPEIILFSRKLFGH